MPQSKRPRKKQQKFIRHKQKIVKLTISDEKLAHGLTKEQSSNFVFQREQMWFNALAHSITSKNLIKGSQIQEMAHRCITRWEQFLIAANTHRKTGAINMLFVFPEKEVFAIYIVAISPEDVVLSRTQIAISLHAWSRIGHRSAHTTRNQAVIQVACEHISLVGLLVAMEAQQSEVLLISRYGKSVWAVDEEGGFLCKTWIDGHQLHVEDRSILKEVGIGFEEPGIAVKVLMPNGKTLVFNGSDLFD